MKRKHIRKTDAIAEILTPVDWERLAFCHYSQGFLFSHAGVHPHWFSHSIHGVTVPYIKKVCDIGRKDQLIGNPDPIFMARRARGGGYGRRPVGSHSWIPTASFNPSKG